MTNRPRTLTKLVLSLAFTAIWFTVWIVLNMVPLRNRRSGVTTRIAEGLTEWRWGDRVGYGWSEYLDHVG
jgi:hypothetical protein